MHEASKQNARYIGNTVNQERLKKKKKQRKTKHKFTSAHRYT